MNRLRRNAELTNEELNRIGGLYQKAFAGPPWFEVSKCASISGAEACESGFSPQKIGETCLKCSRVLTDEAYPMAELTGSIAERLRYPGAALYEEFGNNNELMVSAIFWEADADFIGAQRYRDSAQMQDWLKAELPEPVIWLDEIFADRGLRPKGNLWNFETLVENVFGGSQSSLMAFRTINEGLKSKAQSVFKDRCKVLTPGQVPDRRSFVTIRRNNNE